MTAHPCAARCCAGDAMRCDGLRQLTERKPRVRTAGVCWDQVGRRRTAAAPAFRPERSQPCSWTADVESTVALYHVTIRRVACALSCRMHSAAA
eukprot:2085297-Rhodomonas_salina.3